jgi:glycosyltransferase involved in cell wall biosynthesis
VASPLVSVIVTCFNRQNYIGEAIESILHQTFDDYEIIVIDDGSVDGSAEICKGYGSRVKYFFQENRGASDAKNSGVTRARGKYISFLDSDDIWDFDKLHIQTTYLANNDETDILYSHARQFLSPELSADECARLHCPLDPMAAPTSGTMLVKKSVFEQVGNFRTDLLVGIEIEWYLRAKSLGFSSVTLPNVLLNRRIHATNSGTTHRLERQQHLDILKQHINRRRQAGAGKMP